MKRYKMYFEFEATAKVGGDKIKVSGKRSYPGNDMVAAFDIIEQALRAQYDDLGFRTDKIDISLTEIK